MTVQTTTAVNLMIPSVGRYEAGLPAFASSNEVTARVRHLLSDVSSRMR